MVCGLSANTKDCAIGIKPDVIVNLQVYNNYGRVLKKSS
jgi:hypothetical protein